MSDRTEPRYVTVAYVAEHFGVHANTVRKWIDAGLLHVWRVPSGRLRVPVDELRRFERTAGSSTS